MATQVEGYFGRFDTGDGVNLAIGSTAYGYCQTAAATAAKVVDMTGFTLVTGATIFVKFQYANSVASPTLNVNGTGAKPLYRYGTTAMNTNTGTNGWPAGAVLALTYDGTGWVEHYWNNNTYYYTSVYVDTAAATAAKVGQCSNFALQKGYLQVLLMNANSSQNALTLNINSTGAKAIYINGTVSSSSNYTLPKALYFVYYDGTNYHFRTDGKIAGLGSAAYTESTAYATSGHTHGLSLATDTGTSSISLAANTKYKLTAGGSTYIFTTPPDTNTTYTASTISIGSASTGTAIAADDITAWDPGSTPTLGTSIPADDITAWSAGSLPTATVANGVLTFSMGSLPSLSYTAKSIPNVTTVGSVPSLSYTARSIPNISVTSKTVATGITAG